MRILHLVSGSLKGGAARGAYFLHKALLKSSVDSHLFVNHPQAIQEQSISYVNDNIDLMTEKSRLKVYEKFLVSQYPMRDSYIFSAGYGIDSQLLLSEIEKSDIIHFHWINGMFDIELIRHISKPIVWTLRDMWPFTGGCHYSNGCTRYRIGCGCCEFLKSGEEKDLSKMIFTRKKLAYGTNLFPVAISSWLKECAESSGLYTQEKIEMIPNCVDVVNVFYPRDKDKVRQKLSLSADKKIILFGAINADSDLRKGFDKLMEALQYIENPENYHLVVFGSNAQNWDSSGFSYTLLNHIEDDNFLAEIYSVATVFVAPSIEEAFGKTLIESMACGTPVVAFDATGPKDIIEHEKTGFLAEPFNSRSLAEGIQYVSRNEDQYEILSTLSRNRAINYYSEDVVAKQYCNLYTKIMHGYVKKEQNISIKLLADINQYHHAMHSQFNEFLREEWHEGAKWYWFESKKALEKMANRRIAIFGAGEFGQKVAQFFHLNGVQVECFIDNDARKHFGYIDDKMILPLENCTDMYIVIASTWNKQIAEQLERIGLRKHEQYSIVML